MIKYYVQRLKTAVREMVIQKVRKMTMEERKSLSAVSRVACEVGRSQRALVSERREQLRLSIDVREKKKRDVKPVKMMPTAPMDINDR